ncbi:MAG: hypothetical protein GX557_02895 [Chloroflexi bacterium]|nr:hypothetical protein [Chloroflexota bacterium]
MNARGRGWVYWAPRILSFLFAVFISLFALDVFGTGAGFWETLGALAIHMIPTALIIVALILAWRWEWVGAILFAALGIGYFVMTGMREHWSAYVAIAVPLFVIAVLWLLAWRRRALSEGAA